MYPGMFWGCTGLGLHWGIYPECDINIIGTGAWGLLRTPMENPNLTTDCLEFRVGRVMDGVMAGIGWNDGHMYNLWSNIYRNRSSGFAKSSSGFATSTMGKPQLLGI